MKNDARLDLRLPTALKTQIEEAAEGSVNAWVRDACERKMDPYRGTTTNIRIAREVLEDKSGTLAEAKQSVFEGRADEQRREIERQLVDEIPLPKIAPRKWGS